MEKKEKEKKNEYCYLSEKLKSSEGNEEVVETLMNWAWN